MAIYSTVISQSEHDKFPLGRIWKFVQWLSYNLNTVKGLAESGSNLIENQVLSTGLSVFVVLCKTEHLDLPGQMCDSVQDPWHVELIDFIIVNNQLT